MATKPKPYSQYAYVPGQGKSGQAAPKAIQALGYALAKTQPAAKAAAKTVAAKKAKPLTLQQQAIQQVNAVNAASMAVVNQAAAKAIKDAKAQAQQALGFEHAFNELSQGDAGRIYDAYQNAAAKVSAYGDLALSSAGSSSESAAAQAQNYLASVGPDVGAETRPDIAGALRALGATGVGDVAGSLASQGAYAQERARNVRNAQLMRLSDIGANAMYQGVDTAGQLRSDEIARKAGSRAADVAAALTALKAEGRAQKAEGRAAGEYARAGTLAKNTEARAKSAEQRAIDDQRMKDLAFDVELQQRQVELAASKLANAKGEIERKQAQFELDNAQDVLDASLAEQAAGTASTEATTAATKALTPWEIKQAKAEIAQSKATTAATKAEAKAAGKGKGLTPYQQRQLLAKAHDAAAAFYSPPPPKDPIFGKQQPRMPYKDGLARLTGKYGLTKAQAADVLNVYYKTPGEDGRPVFDLEEQAQLLKLGFTKAQINQASNGYAKAQETGKPNPGYKLFEKMSDRLG